MPPAIDLQPANSMGASRNAVPGYDIPAVHVTRHRLLDMPVRTSSLRSLGAHLNVFAIESFMDELAAAAGADPVAFRLAHLSDPRARQVLTQAADMAGWEARGHRDGIGYGAGVARYSGNAGYCAAVAEVAADTDIRLRRVWLAVDVGRVINPDGVINQVEGGAVQSASWTLAEQVTFDRDKITSAGWDSYPVLRFTEVPEVAVCIMDTPGEPEVGAGEIALGPVAGAIGNAVADAAGVRVRDLPLTRDRIAGPSRRADLMRIDVHAHYWTEDYLDLLVDLGQADAGAARGLGVGAGAELEARLWLMDRAGVQMQVLSACPQLPYGEDRQKAAKAARFVNDQYAGLVQRHPDRFRAFAALPMLLRRADDQYGWDAPDTPERPSVAARRMWHDTVGHGHVPALRCAIDSFGADRLLLGTDFPYENGDIFVRAVDYVNDPQVDTTAAQAILDQNASALLGIGQERQGTASSPVRTR
jgi:hypothetical protein